MTFFFGKKNKIASLFFVLSRSQNLIFITFAQALSALFIIAGIIWFSEYRELIRGASIPLGVDFLNIYAAGILANQGLAGAVYDISIHGAVENAVAGYAVHYLAWHYPPMFLAVASFSALLPYVWAFGLYMAASYAGYWAVLSRAIPKTKECFWMVLAFPGAFCNITNGQNGFFTTAFFGAGAIFLKTRPILAGAAFGLLSYKPQFFALIPVFLIIGGYRRVLFWTLATTAFYAGLSWSFYGAETWVDFFYGLSVTRQDILEEGWAGWHRGQSIMFAVRLLGGGQNLAYAVQLVGAVATLSCAAWIWRTKADDDTHIAVLCAAMMLMTPYLMDYDLTMLIVPMALWAKRANKTGFQSPEKIIYGALWLLPIFARPSGAYRIPLVPIALLALLLWSFLRAKRTLAKSSYAAGVGR